MRHRVDKLTLWEGFSNNEGDFILILLWYLFLVDFVDVAQGRMYGYIFQEFVSKCFHERVSFLSMAMW